MAVSPAESTGHACPGVSVRSGSSARDRAAHRCARIQPPERHRSDLYLDVFARRLVHVITNMWMLWIFGDNIEDYLGHFAYLVFYLLCGLAAGFTHILFNVSSRAPTVGASGAIAGVMGAYLILYPRARVLTWFFFVVIIPFPAWLWLIIWAAQQFLSGTAASLAPAAQAGGIAFWAHIGGFVTGILLVKLFPQRQGRYRYGTW